ncbi:hypothetical protein C8Q76DRAFT_726799 [Earliella scabrosa]|nr:hypothetical protein C8Q76DRAFT_726799 [Earliella scabrosa]
MTDLTRPEMTMRWGTATHGAELRPRQGATSVICLHDFDWMRNSMYQSPCLVASWSTVPCLPSGSWDIVPITSVGLYGGPWPGWGDLFNCQCNTVHYSLAAACAACQGYGGSSGIVNFTVFTKDCPPESLKGSTFPRDIPIESTFPAWAYLDLLDDRWDEKRASALALQNHPDSTHTGERHSTTNVSSTSRTETELPPLMSLTSHMRVGMSTQATARLSSEPASTTTVSACSTSLAPAGNLADSVPREPKGSVAPVVGGAVGGFTVLFMSAVLVWRYFRRRGRETQTASNPAYRPEPVGPIQWVRPALYDPDDPTTFPSTPIASVNSRLGTYAVRQSFNPPEEPDPTWYAGKAEIQ